MELARTALGGLANEDGLIFFPEECETIAVNCVQVEQGQITELATHPDEEEVYVILSGEGSVWLDKQENPVKTGSVVYIPRNVEHIIRGKSEEPLTYVCVANWPDKKSAWQNGQEVRSCQAKGL